MLLTPATILLGRDPINTQQVSYNVLVLPCIIIYIHLFNPSSIFTFPGESTKEITKKKNFLKCQQSHCAGKSAGNITS